MNHTGMIEGKEDGRGKENTYTELCRKVLMVYPNHAQKESKHAYKNNIMSTSTH